MGLFEGVITDEELFQFYNDYNLNLSDCDENIYSIKPFIQLVSESAIFESILNNLKISFIYNVLNHSLFSNIIQRQIYFMDNPTKVFNPPKETCSGHLYRVLITHEPPPYHFDFIIANLSAKVIENLILTIKYLKGYGNRCKSSLNRKTPSRKSSFMRSVHVSQNSKIVSIKKNNKVHPI